MKPRQQEASWQLFCTARCLVVKMEAVRGFETLLHSDQSTDDLVGLDSRQICLEKRIRRSR
jgi:hypothetical protein